METIMQKIKLHIAVLTTLCAVTSNAYALDKDAVTALEQVGTVKTNSQAQAGAINIVTNKTAAISQAASLTDVKPVNGVVDDKAKVEVKPAETESSKEFKKGTIGSLSEKQKKLFELEIETKIAEAEKKLKPSPAASIGANSSIATAGSLPLPTIVAPPAPVKKKSTKSMKPVIMEEPMPVIKVNSVYGQDDNLTAEFSINGIPVVGKRNAFAGDGWMIASVSSDMIVIKKGAKTHFQKVVLSDVTKSAASGYEPMNPNSYSPLPPLPMIQDATSYNLPKLNASRPPAVASNPQFGVR